MLKIILCLSVLLCVSTPAYSTVVISAPDGYSIACASNYLRLQPHYCAAVTNFESWSVVPNSCSVRTLTTIPSSAKMLRVEVVTVLMSTNTVTLKNLITQFYNDAVCATPIINLYSSLYEQVATIDNTELFRSSTIVDVLAYAGTSLRSYSAFTNTGASSALVITILGYFD